MCLTEKVISTVLGFGTPFVLEGKESECCDEMGDGILAKQNFFNQQSHDFWAFHDSLRHCASAKGMRESFC